MQIQIFIYLTNSLSEPLIKHDSNLYINMKVDYGGILVTVVNTLPGHRIEYDYVEENGKIIAVDVFIDGHPYAMNRQDLWQLHLIVKTCWEFLPDPILEDDDETNH